MQLFFWQFYKPVLLQMLSRPVQQSPSARGTQRKHFSSIENTYVVFSFCISFIKFKTLPNPQQRSEKTWFIFHQKRVCSCHKSSEVKRNKSPLATSWEMLFLKSLENKNAIFILFFFIYLFGGREINGSKFMIYSRKNASSIIRIDFF